ncbi:5'-3' exonuclease PLD3 [Anabrus simplex]|uniref:5'-3' exonuclease PLD3 n=1 Tax=Anabrus simplex TaxID=316456 RepID=UPI0035A3D1CA
MVGIAANAQVKKREPVIEDVSVGSGRLDVASEEAELELWDSRFMLRGDHEPEPTFRNARWGPRGWCKPSCIPITIILILIVLVVLLPLVDNQSVNEKPVKPTVPPVQLCKNSCRFSLVESIPEGMVYPKGSTPHPSTVDTWLNLINMAEFSIEIASFYWTLQQGEVYPDPSSKQGGKVFQSILDAGTKRNISIFIAQNSPSESNPNIDTKYLAKQGAAQVRSVNFTKIMGGGVLHTKLWIIDRTHLYVGSANMDWRSLTQVKEMGAVAYNCSCLAGDMGKIFDVYWMLGLPDAQIPGSWPDKLGTQYNIQAPMNVTLNDIETATYISSSPPSFCPAGRSTDLSAILNVIGSAEKFIYISVMDYVPLTIYTPKVRLWQEIDDALRAAAVSKFVKVHLLVSKWNHTKPAMAYFLRSLEALNGSYPGVEVLVKWFTVPVSPEQEKIPFARVNHNKYMVTDKTAYIGTSNWSGDYFISTGGVGLVITESAVNGTQPDGVRAQLQAVFERDWNSKYAQPLTEVR